MKGQRMTDHKAFQTRNTHRLQAAESDSKMALPMRRGRRCYSTTSGPFQVVQDIPVPELGANTESYNRTQSALHYIRINPRRSWRTRERG